MGDQPFGRVRLIEMVVESVRVHMLSSQHVVILKESERDRYLPVWIGQSEANAIAMRLQGLSADRPLTHDLLVSVVAAANSRISRIVVTHVNEGIFHARLYLEAADGTETEVDSRTSDAIAVAVRTGSTIYVDERVLDEAGVEPEREDEADDEKLSVFREFVNSLDIDLPGGEEKGAPAEGDADHRVVGLGDQRAMERVPALTPIADDRVDRIARIVEAFEEKPHLAQVELQVAVAEADQPAARVGEPRLEGAAVAAVRLMVDAHPGVGGGHGVGEL